MENGASGGKSVVALESDPNENEPAPGRRALRGRDRCWDSSQLPGRWSVALPAAALPLMAAVARGAEPAAPLPVAIIGPGGMGRSHLEHLVGRKDVRGAWACDVDADRLAALVHLGNIACRLARTLHVAAAAERIVGDDEANRLLTRAYRDGHWAVPRGV